MKAASLRMPVGRTVTRAGRIKAAGVLIAALCGAAFIFAVDPHHAWFMPPCLFHAVTGLNCPGCGSFRALHALLHGDILVAFDYNIAVMTVAVPLGAYFFLDQLFAAVLGRGLPSLRIRPAVVWAVAAAILVFTILRNIPVAPFTWLAP
jgi:hypothetical protein